LKIVVINFCNMVYMERDKMAVIYSKPDNKGIMNSRRKNMKRYILLTVLLAVFMASNAVAAIFNVNSPATFQAALVTAENNSQNDTINVAAGIYNLTSTLDYTPAPAGGENFSLTIQGAGGGLTVIDDNGNNLLLLNIENPSVDTNAHIIIRGITFQNGNGPAHGGGLYVNTNSANITVEDCIFSGNSATWGGGAHVFINNDGTINLTNNTFSGNSATWGGGADVFLNNDGTINLTNNTFSGNSATWGGGADVSLMNDGTVNLTNNTFSGNSATWGGGADVSLMNDGTVNLTNNTFTGNSADFGGGLSVFLQTNVATANIYNNIIWNNTASAGGNDGDDLDILSDGNADNIGSPVYLFNNNLGINANFATAQSEDLIVSDTDNYSQGSNIQSNPQLGPLQDNGGPTQTHALLFPSPAIDAGNNSVAVITDQRGYVRIWDGDGNGSAIVDIGAYEYGAPLYSQSIPMMTQWGMIIFVVLAGLGAVYYLRRQRRAER
jgi:hypothetical protein